VSVKRRGECRGAVRYTLIKVEMPTELLILPCRLRIYGLELSFSLGVNT